MYMHTHIYVNLCLHVYVAVHVINPPPYLDKTPPGCRAGLADNTVIWGTGQVRSALQLS